MVEGYENPVAGITRSSEDSKDSADDEGDDGDDDDTANNAAGSKTKKPKSTSTKSISILSRTTSEFDTCSAEKPVEFDPVQGNTYIPFFFST